MSLKSFFSQKMPIRSDVRMTDIAPRVMHVVVLGRRDRLYETVDIGFCAHKSASV